MADFGARQSHEFDTVRFVSGNQELGSQATGGDRVDLKGLVVRTELLHEDAASVRQHEDAEVTHLHHVQTSYPGSTYGP